MSFRCKEVPKVWNYKSFSICSMSNTVFSVRSIKLGSHKITDSQEFATPGRKPGCSFFQTVECSRSINGQGTRFYDGDWKKNLCLAVKTLALMSACRTSFPLHLSVSKRFLTKRLCSIERIPGNRRGIKNIVSKALAVWSSHYSICNCAAYS